MHFWEGEVQPDNVVRLSLPTRRLVAEGLERRDELFRLLALVEDPDVRLVQQEAEVGSLAANERAFLQALDSQSGFQAVCRQVGLDPLSGVRTLQLLSLIGAVKIDRPAASAAKTTDLARQQEDSVRSWVRDHVLLLTELTAPIVALDGCDAVAERLTGLISDVAKRHPVFLKGLQVGVGGALDPEDLTARALRLPGDRERTISAALGEVISYLDFELRHHPQIQEPEHFLDAVEELRAKLEH